MTQFEYSNQNVSMVLEWEGGAESAGEQLVGQHDSN